MKILIISDAWHPQINGVVRTLEMTVKELARLGHETRIVGPEEGKSFTFAMPFYPEIKLEFLAHRRLWRVLREFQPDFIHITTEGPLGWAARRVCLHRNLSFSTAYHTRFPEYLAPKKGKVPLELLTNEGSAPSSTSQFDPVINNFGRLRGRQPHSCKHRDMACCSGVFQGNLRSASRRTYGYVPGQPEHTGLLG